MIKVVYCFKKRADLSDSVFSEYWEKVHGPIGARIPGLRKLVQSLAIKSTRGAREPDFDGMAELWFDDLESLQKARRSSEWRTSSEDEVNFIDHSKIAYFVAEERIIV
jgi:uncharacterized protein (TIGR02118 family)